MAASGRAIFQAHMDSFLPESIPLDVAWTLSNGIVGIMPNVSLSSGDNTIAVPTGTQLIVLIPPTTNAATIKWKGNGADTGMTGIPNKPNIRDWSAGTVIVNCSSGVSPATLIFVG